MLVLSYTNCDTVSIFSLKHIFSMQIHVGTGDFKSSALQHITEKAVRFMRAHLAQAIVDASPMSDTDCMRLVENTLEFDHALSQTFLPSMSVSAVLYDARTLHAQWVKADHYFFTAYLCDACKEDAAIFSFRQPFTSSKTYHVEHSSVASLTDDGLCYKAVYDLLHIFLLGKSQLTYCSSNLLYMTSSHNLYSYIFHHLDHELYLLYNSSLYL